MVRLVEITRFVLLASFLLILVNAHKPFGRHSHGAGERDSVDGRVPRDVIPYHYAIDITPDIYLPAPPFPFTGTVQISVECVVATNVITLNSKWLTIASAGVTVSPDSTIIPPQPGTATWQLEPAADFLQIIVPTGLVVGAKYSIAISYSGTLTDDGNGIYWDSYKAADNSTKYMLATQLEDIAARQMYPCLDEPDLKATFNVTVAHLSTVTSLSNMPVIRVDDRGNGWVASVYDISPIMSTYQVCVCIGDLRFIEAAWQGVVPYPIRVYSRPEVIDLMWFAANISVKIQRWLEIETGHLYPLPKMDHIAIPSKGGAMENWGLITYGEQYFAVNPETNSLGGARYLGSIVAHELSHQWYGNLVTAEWWTDIWLNEGFATYYDYNPMEALGWPTSEPQQLDTQDFLEDDAKNTSDPVRKQINKVWDAGYSFSGSTYPKGGAMLRMLQGILTNPTFKAGLTSYLTTYQYSNAVTDDLWQSLTEQAASEGYNIDIKTVMDPWLNQMGFPVVTVTRSADGTARLTQKQFLYPPNQQMTVASQWNYKWTIPITVATAATVDWSARPTAWFNIAATELVLTGLPTDLSQWVIINTRQLLYYRVNYDTASHGAIVQQLVTDNTKILHESRCSYLDDTFTLARASYIPETTAMEATLYLGNERSFNPWYTALKYTTLSHKMLNTIGAAWIGEFSSYMLSLIVPTYDALGWTYSSTEDPDEQTLRRDIVSSACNYGHQSCIDNVRIDWDVYALTPDINTINPNNLPLTLCHGVFRGGDTEWNLVFDQYQKRKSTPIRDERYAYLFGVACSADDATLDRLLTDIIQGVLIDSRDQYRATLFLAMNYPLGEQKVWNYFDNSWTTVPSGMSKFSVLKHITKTWADQASLDKLNAFIAKNGPNSQSEWNDYNQMKLRVEQNVVWMTANHDQLRDWVAVHRTTSSSWNSAFRLPMDAASYWRSLRAETDTDRMRK